jgi:hypothetical protein
VNLEGGDDRMIVGEFGELSAGSGPRGFSVLPARDGAFDRDPRSADAAFAGADDGGALVAEFADGGMSASRSENPAVVNPARSWVLPETGSETASRQPDRSARTYTDSPAWWCLLE